MTQRAVVRFLLLGLPIGLAISVVVGLYFYYHPLDVLPHRSRSRPQVGHLLRKSPTEKDLSDYRAILTTSLTPRTLGDAKSLETTAQWIASTLGPSNMGHDVELVESRTPFADGTYPRHVLAMVPGQRSSQEVLLLAASYSEQPNTFNAANTALLLSVANAFVKAPQRETMVFAFLDDSDPQALETVAAHLKKTGKNFSGVLILNGQKASPEILATAAPTQVQLTQPHSDFARRLREHLLPRLKNGQESAAETALLGELPLAVLSWPLPALEPEEVLLSIARALEASLPSLANR